MNVAQLVKDNPWPALALAVGAGVLLSGSRADAKAAAATVVATKGATNRLSGVLDDLVSQVISGFHGAIEQRIEGLASDVKRAIGAPSQRSASTVRTGAAFDSTPDLSSSPSIPRAD